MNKAELRAAVKLRNGLAIVGDGLATDTNVDDCVTAALIDYSGAHTWPWLLTTGSVSFTAGVGALPAACQSVRTLIIDGLPARRGTYEAVLEQTELYVWTEQGANLLLYPAGTLTGTLHYYRVDPVLASDAAIPLLPTQWHQKLVALASYHVNVRRGQSERAAQDLTEWQTGLKDLMNAGWRSSGARQVRDGFRPRQTARWVAA